MGLVLPLALFSSLRFPASIMHGVGGGGMVPIVDLEEANIAGADDLSTVSGADDTAIVRSGEQVVQAIPQRSYRSLALDKKSEVSTPLKLGMDFFKKYRRDPSADGSSVGLSNLVKDWAGRNQWSRRRHYISKKSVAAPIYNEDED